MLVFVLPQRQRVEERVFSIKEEEVEVESLKKVSLISKRLVYKFTVSNNSMNIVCCLIIVMSKQWMILKRQTSSMKRIESKNLK